MSFTEQVKNELARVVRPDKESRSGELLALLRMGGAIVTGAAGEKGRGIFYGEQRRCPPCPRLPEKRFQSYAVSYGAAGTEAATKKNVYTLTVRPSADSLRFLGKWDWIRSWISVMRPAGVCRRTAVLSGGAFSWRWNGEPAAR